MLFAITIGLGAGAASILFRRLITLCHGIFFGVGAQSIDAWSIIPATLIIVPLGGLIVGLITQFFAPETKGHGVPEVIVAVAHNGGRIRARVAVFKTLTAAITIGSGGSAGREGPIVQIGAAFGSALAQFMRLPDRRIILAVACGAAGGVAATFNAPMAGVIFALEVILGRFTGRYFAMVVMSSATATVVARYLGEEGDRPAFRLAQEHGMIGVPDLLCFIGLGMVCALVAQAYIRSIHAVEMASERLRAPAFVKPALGGAVVGALAIWWPQIMGSGYEPIEQVLNNDATLTMGLLFALTFAKIIATALTVGSGGSGGVFAPSLFIGATFGGAYGHVMHSLAPSHVSSPGAYALIGMAAVFAAAAHAPVTAIFILFEMTDEYRIIIPLMSATVVSTLLSQALARENMYTLRLKSHGIELNQRPDINLMDAITVAEAMDEVVEAVPPNLPMSDLVEKLAHRHETGYPVIDTDGCLCGIVTMRDVEEALMSEKNAEELTVADICTRHVVVCRPDQSLSDALSKFGAHNLGRLPVIDPLRPDHIVGILDRQHVIDAYASASRENSTLGLRIDDLQGHQAKGRMVLESAILPAGAALSHREVRDANFPANSILGAIRRGNETLVPRGSTRMLPGDELIVLTTREHLPHVRNWLQQNT
jgi:CIC family chloride channel protein